MELAASGSSTHKFYSKALIMLLIPVLTILIAFILYVILKNKRGALMTTIIVVALYFQQAILQTSLTFFQCRNLYRDDTIEYFLIGSPDLACVGNHMSWAIGVSVPFLLIWGFAIPIGLLYVIHKNKHQLHSPVVRLKYAFLVEGYVPERAYWESYYMLRRMVLVVIAIIVPYLSGAFAVLLCSWLVIEALLIQIKYKPFEREIANTLEKYSLFSISIIFFVGMYFKMVSMETRTKNAFDGIMLALLIVTFTLFVLCWLREYLRVIAVSIGGKIGDKLIHILKNPENLEAPPKDTKKGDEAEAEKKITVDLETAKLDTENNPLASPTHPNEEDDQLVFDIEDTPTHKT
jgi:hypothetical protein